MTKLRSLAEFQQRMARLHQQPGLGARSLGVAADDLALHAIGQKWLDSHADEVAAALVSNERGGDVYLATRLFDFGGHTALIGDFVQALAESEPLPSLLLTDPHQPFPLPDEILSRSGIPAGNVRLITGASLEERLDELFRELLRLRPRRLFLFHHPKDPLPAAVCHPLVAQQRILVHHADSTPTFGIFLPEQLIIDLNPIASSITRLLGLESELLVLTAPDVGLRETGFLTRGHLTTASCGSQYKFKRKHTYNYAETVGVILQTTGGWHFHIGPLDSEMLREIGGVLSRKKIASERFIHVEWVPSVAAFLLEQSCDLYFSSFPVDGARTNAEVLSSSTPHLRFSSIPKKQLPVVQARFPVVSRGKHGTTSLRLCVGSLMRKSSKRSRNK